MNHNCSQLPCAQQLGALLAYKAEKDLESQTHFREVTQMGFLDRYLDGF